VATSATPAYPHLSESPYAVAERRRRRRAWFPGEVTIDQGQSAGVVGFAWTHWLLCRGIAVPEPVGDYALELYRESQRVAGLEPDDNTLGSWIWAGERVLRERGLLEASYACPDVETVVSALLERGPLIAGLPWHASMSTPEEVDGRSVCRLEEGPPQGGHAVVLDGIDLDLTLAGVRGFVRFKNSWGTFWGDDGHALVSLADLERLLAGASDVLLPIPAASVLPAGARPDLAEEEPPEGGYERQSIGSDLWTLEDSVGYGAYADAIARGIQHDETVPPLTIGIKAPWGAGKTSLMRMIRERLEWPSGRRGGEPRRLHLVGAGDEGEPMTHGAMLRRVASRDRPLSAREMTAAPEATGADERRWRPTVWFNPWMYQTGEQVWAGLAHEIVTQVTERMPRAERERFWLELNVRRIDEHAVRRRIYALVVERVLPWALGGLVAVLAGLGLLALNAWAGAGLIAAGPAGAALVAAAQLRKVMAAPPSGALAQLVAPATEQLLRSPDYASRTGFFHLLQADLQRVLDLVATRRRPLVVFVDDLDRCAPGTVVQVIEAINLFLAGQYPNCVFVIAMEPEMVAAHVEAAYGSLAQRLGDSFDLGWRFLEKIVQLPLTLPALERERATEFAGSLLGGRARAAAAAAERDVRAAERPLEGATLSQAVEAARDVGPGDSAVSADAVRRSVEKRLSADDPEVREAIEYGARFLDANPREIKRFVNVFRFLVMIHTERVLEGLASAATLEQLAKLAVISTRWPSHMSALARPADSGDGRTVFELVEGGSLTPPLPAPLLACLRAEPAVGAAARHYL
jgi:hypothetical protein